jgi:membrane protein
MNFCKKLYRCVYQSIEDTINHDGVEHAGYLSFLLMLAIFPFLFFLMAIVSLFGTTSLFEYIIDFIVDNTIDNIISVLKPRIKEITSAPPSSLLTFAILSAIWTASSIFEAMRTILNKASRVTKPPSYLFRRFVSIVEFILIILMTIFVMFIFGILPSILSDFVTYFELKNSAYYIAFEEKTKFFRDIIVFFYVCFLVSFLYFFLPNKKQKFSHTIPGVICVILAWTVFTYVFKYYLATFSQLNVIYGSIVGVIISLLYFYFCSIIFVFGAEFNYNFFEIFSKDNKTSG